jgi:hypothetical protein
MPAAGGLYNAKKLEQIEQKQKRAVRRSAPPVLDSGEVG